MCPALRWWPALLLAGCAQLPPLLEQPAAPDINAHSPGVAVTQTRPPRLAALTFFTTTVFDGARAADCSESLLQAQQEGASIVRYRGRDMLSAEGRVDNRASLYGVLPVRDRIRFELTLLAKVSGTTYGFRRIELFRHDPLGLNGHDYRPLPPSGTETRQVYQRLQRLYRELDQCINAQQEEKK